MNPTGTPRHNYRHRDARPPRSKPKTYRPEPEARANYLKMIGAPCKAKLSVHKDARGTFTGITCHCGWGIKVRGERPASELLERCEKHDASKK